MASIGRCASDSGLTAKTLRHYDEIGLVVPGRLDNGYRDYTVTDIRKLTFIHHACRLGFSIGACRELLSLYEDRNRSSADALAVALKRLKEVDAKLEALRRLRATLLKRAQKFSPDPRHSGGMSMD